MDWRYRKQHDADHSQVFMGMKNLFHAIHAAGLGDILQYGDVTDVDDEHYWSFLEATYIDDVSTCSRTNIRCADVRRRCPKLWLPVALQFMTMITISK